MNIGEVRVRRGIVWLASYPRSGNTWSRAFLAAIEKVRAGETASDIQLAGRWEPSLVPGRPNAAVLKKRFLEQAALAARHPGLVLMKTHTGRFIIEGVPTINEKATHSAVYLVRDPRDVALSFAKLQDITVEKAIDAMADRFFVGLVGKSKDRQSFELYGSWSNNVASWAGAPSTLIVRYEDLHQAPIRWFGAIAAHFGIRATLMQTAAAVEATNIERMRADSAALENENIPLGPGIVGRWKDILPANLQKRIEADHGEQMRRFGYL